jgi:hypothetical protein
MALAMHGDGEGNGYGNGFGDGNSNGEAHFVGGGHVVLRDIVLCSHCMQHCCNARLCGNVSKMPLFAMLLVSSFSCVSVRTAAFVNGNEEGDGNGNKGVGASNDNSNKEGNGNGNEGGRQQRGLWQHWQKQWQWHQGWQAINSNNSNGNKGGG